MAGFDPKSIAELLKDPKKAAEFLKNPKAAEEFVNDPKALVGAVSDHIDKLAKVYQRLKEDIHEPTARAYVHEMADKVAEAKEKLPAALTDFFDQRDASKQKTAQIAKRATEKVAEMRQRIAAHRKRKDDILAAAAKRKPPATTQLERIGPRLRKEILERYASVPNRPERPLEASGLFEDWVWADGSSTAPGVAVPEPKPVATDVPAEPPSPPATKPLPSESDLPARAGSMSFDSWCGTMSVSTESADLPPLQAEPTGPPLDVSAKQELGNLSWAASSSDIEPRSDGSDPRGDRSFSSWIASMGPGIVQPHDRVAPKPDDREQARRRFFDWKEGLAEEEGDR